MLDIPKIRTSSAEDSVARRENSNKGDLLTGSGTSISESEAVDLLSRLRTGHLKVQAIVLSPDGVSSAMLGCLRSRVDDRLWAITSETENSGTALSFDLSTAVARRFGEGYSMRADASFPFRFRFESALSFAFRDGSTLALFELEEAPSNKNS